LLEYEARTKKFTVWGEDDGLDMEKDLQWIRCFDGRRLFLAQLNALWSFCPEQWQKNTGQPGLIISSLHVNDSALTADVPLHALDLDHTQSKLDIEFDAINYDKPEQTQYAFMLSGLDKGWSISERNAVSYANLSPGHYIFHVKAINFAGVWSSEYLLSILIRPPFYTSAWFLSLCVLALGTVFFFFVRYISQRNLRMRILILEKEQAVEKERNRIARDMHDDLGSGLTKIAILSEVAKTQLGTADRAVSQLEKISDSSRELVDSLQDIIWVLNPRNDSLESLGVYIREHAVKFFESMNVEVIFDYPATMPTIRLSEEVRRNIFLVVKETLNNTAKHSNCSKVFIALVCRSHDIRLTINDNGRGFAPTKIRDFANGLANMQARMSQINGGYQIHSILGKGTFTTITLRI
jgi:signal transduction histidine kinase